MCSCEQDVRALHMNLVNVFALLEDRAPADIWDV